MNNNSMAVALRKKEQGSKRSPDRTSSGSNNNNRLKKQRLSHLENPPTPLALREKDSDGNIILRLPQQHPMPLALALALRNKLPEKKPLPHLPDEIWQKIFKHAAEDWQDKSWHFHTISFRSLLSLWQGCKCCTLPVGLYVNHLARDVTMDVMRSRAVASSGTSHVVKDIIGPLKGVVIADFSGSDNAQA